MKESDAIKIIAEIIVAIDYLHKEGIIYRDLKPSNVLFSEDHHVRLTDFGLRKKFFGINLDEAD